MSLNAPHKPAAAAALRLLLASSHLRSRQQAPGDRLFIGLTLEACSFACGVFGKQLLRLGHVKGSTLTRVIGFLLQSFGGPLLDALALGYAAQSILALSGGLDAVACMFVAPWLNGESLSLRKILGACLITGGTVVAAVAGPTGESDHTYSLSELPFLLTRFPVTVWAGIFVGVCALCLREIRRASKPAARGLAIGTLAGMFDGNSWCLKIFVRLLETERIVSLLCSPLFMLIALGAVGSAICSMALLVRGTEEFETVYLVPLVDGARIVSAALSGLLVMNEMRGMQPLQLLGYTLAVLGVLLGILTLFLDKVRRAPLRFVDADARMAANAEAGESATLQPQTLSLASELLQAASQSNQDVSPVLACSPALVQGSNQKTEHEPLRALEVADSTP
eukprot:TRINITY_DN18194_c0_g1_i4.p1 TRINITY_DN18194_c0_g1~~TRINITY_DN18194_c0_g1_i4.p1  ORF type:complete len:394 (-),score=25.83 TRINITY_DN18194_c0_g1_i4:362-1543(-)